MISAFHRRQGCGELIENTQTTFCFEMHVPIQRQATLLESAVLPSGKIMKPSRSRTSFETPIERQCTAIDPISFSGKGYENLKILRHRTTDFDVWSIVPDKKSIPRLKTVPENTPANHSRPISEISTYGIERKEGKKFPILGPTRQQTELYFKDRKKQLQGLSLPGPTEQPEALNRRFNSEYTTREDKTLDSLTNSNKKLRNNFSNITSGSIISRKNKNNVVNGDTTENVHDVRFFAELVKPLQYRLRVHEKEEKEKILFPSKYGFHQRSHSPTFRRLLEATEKLKIISQHESVQNYIKQKASKKEEKIAILRNTDNEKLEENKPAEEELPKTPEVTARSPESPEESPVSTSKEVDIRYNDVMAVPELPDNDSIFNDIPVEEDEVADEKAEQDHSIKVDFKVGESHAELHLFLPKINSGNKSAKSKNDLDETSSKSDRSGPIILPSIKVDSIHQMRSYQNQPIKKPKRPDTIKKKRKRPVERVKSAADQDRKIKDHLNDVHTLISIADHHSTDTICEFPNCPYHSLLKENPELNSNS